MTTISLMVTVMVAISMMTEYPVATASTIPRTTTIVPITLPLECKMDDGTVLFPGKEKMTIEVGACKVCHCSHFGQLACNYDDCMVPMCVDAHRSEGQCCARCPNGPNCRIPSTGEVIDAGRPAEREGMVCECPPQSFSLPGKQTEADITAICRPVTTTPTPTTMPADALVGRRR